jgi:hypothetical protein
MSAEAATVVLRGQRRGRVSGPVVPRPPVPPAPPARPVTAARPPARPAAGPVAGIYPTRTSTGLGYPPPTAYPAVPVAPNAALVPAGLAAPLSGIFPVEVPPSSGIPLLDRALAHGRWLLACEPESRGGHGSGCRR